LVEDEHNQESSSMLTERQREEQAERVAIFEAGGKRKRRGRKRRSLGVAAVLLLVLAFFLPQLVGVFGKGVVESKASAALGVDVRIDRLGLSWFGSQRVTGLRVVDSKLREAADVDVRASKSLVGLLANWKSFGTVEVSGKVLLDQTEGPLAEILGSESEPAQSEQSGGIPMDLSGSILFNGLDVRYRSDDVEIAAEEIAGSLDIKGANGIGITLNSPRVVRDGVASEVGLVAALDDYVDSSGEFDLKKAILDGELSIASDRAPLGLVVSDAVSIGRSELSVQIEGAFERGTARLTHRTPDSEIELPIAYRLGEDSYAVEVAGAGTARIGASVVAAYMPELSAYVGQEFVLESGRVVELSQLPGVTVQFDELSAVVPTSGAIDPGSVVARLAIETGELRGRLDGERWVVEPMAVEIGTRGVRRGVSVQAVTTAQLGGRPAGVFVLNAEADDLFESEPDALSSLDEIVERLFDGLQGGFEINDVETALIESVVGPMLASSGVVLSEDLGETVAAEVSFSGGTQQIARVWITSENLRVGSGFVIDEGVIRSDGSGVRAEAESMASFVSRMADVPGLTLTGGGGGELWVRDLAIDLSRLTAGEGVDWRSVKGFVELRLEPMVGEIVDQGESKAFETSASAVSVDLLDVQTGASVAAGMSIRVADEPAGELNISLRARDLIDGSGALIAGVPTVEGEVSLRGALSRLAQPYVDVYGLALEQDLGPVVEVVAQASVDAAGVVSVDATLSADRLTGSAQLEIQDRVLRGVEEGLSLEVRRVGDLIARWLPDGITPMQGGGVRVGSDDFVLALGEGRIDWSRSQVSGSVGVLGVSVSDAEGRHYEIERLDGEVSLGSAENGSLIFNSVIQQRGEPVPAAGHFTLVGLVDGDRLALDKLRLDGQMDIGGFPISAAADAVDMGARDLRSLTAELVGRLMDVSIAADAASGELVVTVTGDRLVGNARASFVGGELRMLGGRFESVIGPEVIEQVRIRSAQASGMTEPTGARFIRPASVELEVGGFGVLDGWAFAPSGSPVVKLVASGHVEGALFERNGELIECGLIGISPMVIEGLVPVGSILGGETAQTSLAVTCEIVSDEIAVALVTGGLDVGFAAGVLDGQVGADLKLSSLDCGQIDEVAHLDGYVAGVAGAKLDAEFSVNGVMAAGEVLQLAGELSVESPRLRTRTPIKVAVDSESVWLSEPVVVDWQIEQGIATHRLLAQPVGAERIYSVDPIDTELRIEELRLSRTEGFFAPGVFGIEAALLAPVVSVRVPSESDDPEGKLHTYSALTLRVSGDTTLVSFDGGAMPDDGRADPLVFDLDVQNFADEQGRFSREGFSTSVDVTSKDSPAALFDALLSQGGMLAEVVGPTVSFEIHGSDLQAESGQLRIDLVGTRATGYLVGRMFEGRFIATEPAVLTVREVRPELGQYLSRAVPVIGTISKTAEDGPAILTFNTLEVPLLRDSELSRLKGLSIEAIADIGTARFETSSAFSDVMKATGQRSEGGLGHKINPIPLTINSGNLTYPRSKIPIGEFTIETEGHFRLTDGYINIVTFVPMAALSEEALGSLKTGVTSAIGRQFPGVEAATMVPWRTKGLPEDRTTSPDVELLLQNIGDVFNPLNLLEQGLGTLGGLQIDSDEEAEEDGDK
jgi:hypothetical protein